MSAISAADVKTLRERTNMPMMECKAALTEANGDMEKAVEILRKKGVKVKPDRAQGEGRIGIWLAPDHQLGAMVDLRCESAPVAKNDLFIKLAEDLARQVGLKAPASPAELLAQPFIDDPKVTVNDKIRDVIALIRETMTVARIARLPGPVGAYAHHDGSIGVLFQVEGEKADPQLLRDVCMHITARTPLATRREDVPADIIAKEKEIARAQAAATGKPANILDKIAEGKLKTFFAENVLLEQPFVKDDTQTVGDLLKAAGLKAVKFVRFKVGETS
jgi:elongation factor Ts